MTKGIYVLGAILFLLAVGAYYQFSRQPIAPAITIPINSPVIQQNATQNDMSFFVTSSNPGKGADLGGLVGADAFCQSLASAAGFGEKTWRAYLSTKATDASPAVNARDRIGTGPWVNFQGVVIAENIDQLHSNNNLTKQNALTEKGTTITGRGDTPNRHDILTGSTPQGTVIESNEDTTCDNWTSSTDGAAMVGHHDRVGLDDSESARSWNSSHLSRGCSADALQSSGGAGLFYCFAVKGNQ